MFASRPVLRGLVPGIRALATRAVPMAPLSPAMRSGLITKWHAREGDFVPVGGLLYDVRVDRLTDELTEIDMEVEGHEDVFISSILVREGERAQPGLAVALAVDEEKELGGVRLSNEEIRALAKRDEHQFMWQGYVRNKSDSSGMCETSSCAKPSVIPRC